MSLNKRGTGVCFNLLVTLAIFLAAIPVQSQDKKEPRKSADEEDVIKVSSHLVNVDVMVKDKRGKAITDLKAEDFVLSENGVRQNIEFFDSTLASGNDNVRPGTVSVSTGPRPPTGLPRNIIALVLDGQSTEGANLKHVRDGMTEYIREHISDTDSVALFAISGGLQLLQPFTQDKAKLISAVEQAESISSGSKTSEQRSINETIATLRDKLATGPTGAAVTTPAGGSAAAQAMISQRVLEQYIQLRSALSSQQTRPVLAGLAAICEGLRTIAGKKTLVVFSQGFVAPQNLDWQVQSTIDIANRANVAIYIIDSSGLTGGTPQSGALVPSSALAGISATTSQENRMRAGAGESVFDVTRQEGLNRQQDLLYRISGDTGGQFIKNTNDIAAGLKRVDEEIRSRYTLAYRSTDPNFDGSFRKVKIEVRRSDAKVLARPGYYAIPPSQVVPFSPEDKKLLASFDAASAHPTLPLFLQVNSFRFQPGYYIVPLSFEIPPAAIEFGPKGDKQHLQLDVLGLVRAEGSDQVLSRLGGNFDVELSARQYESIMNDKIFYRQDVMLEPGSYTIDLIVKDKLSGKIAAKRQSLSLPNTDSEFSGTEAVLSRHAEPAKQLQTGAADVLSAGNAQIRPSPSREFQTADNLIIFFELYNATPMAATNKSLVKVTVTLMKDGKPAMKPLDYELSEVAPEPVPHLTFAKYVKLAGLAPGKYTAVIEAVDQGRKKVLKQEAWFVIAN
ncbi:MAG: Acidobact VWFA-related Acidobacterial [Acidobacteria bacterium]|nr:Acidobact VWFA-related Acidobacterial [Acidobacteriota bacterium]